MPLEPFTTIRRIVTGHTPSGTAIFSDDRTLAPFEWTTASPTNDPLASPSSSSSSVPAPDPEKDVCFTNIFRTAGFPLASLTQDPWEETNRLPIPLYHEAKTTVRAVDFPPGAEAPMHRTCSLDFAIVLRGEVVVRLDEGVEKVCREGDVVVQRGTIHAWFNRTKAPARLLFVLVPAEKIEIGGKTLEDVAPGEAEES